MGSSPIDGFIMVSRKIKRHSGWSTPSSTLKMEKRDMINQCLEPQIFYDEWCSFKDGFRNWMGDKSKLRKKGMLEMYSSWREELTSAFRKNNFKLKRLLKRRKAKKLSLRNH